MRLDVQDVVAKARRLCQIEDDESEPYKSRYEAAELLQAAVKSIESQLQASSSSDTPAAEQTAPSSHETTAEPLVVDGAPAVPTSAAASGALPPHLISDAEVPSQPDELQQDSAALPVVSVAPPSQSITDATSTDSTERSPQLDELQQDLATLRARRGITLVETDLRPEAERDMRAALTVLEGRRPLRQAALLLEVYNAMGALASNRGDHDAAIPWLEKAEELYTQQTAAGTSRSSANVQPPAPPTAAADPPSASPTADDQHQTGTQQQQQQQEDVQVQPQPTPDAVRTASSPIQQAEPGPPSTSSSLSLQAELDSLHVSTLFYLAQVYGHAGRKDKSAAYCAATLHRQLISGSYRAIEWVTNCLGLFTYYSSANAFAPAQYCLEAALKVAQMGAGVEGGAGADPTVTEEDLPANLKLAQGRIYMSRLVASHAQFVDHREPPPPQALPTAAELQFPSLGLPPLSSYPSGRDALVTDFEGARSLFNKALPLFKAALDHFKLDGWVTDHCNIVMEVSNLYRCLAGFETDPHRACVMHKQRAKYLEPLSGQLSPEHYPGLARSIDLELGNIYREMVEIKEEGGRPSTKVSNAGKAATKYYQAFIDSFKQPDGSLPTQMEDEENQRYFLHASFCMGRILHKCDAGNEAEAMAAAHRHLLWAVEYVRRNQVTEFSQEANLATQLAGLMAEKIDLVNRLKIK